MDFQDDGCNFSDTLAFCYAHNQDCDLLPVLVCPGCGEKFHHAHIDCKAVNMPVVRPGDTVTISYEFDMTKSKPGDMWVESHTGRVHTVGIDFAPVVIHESRYDAPKDQWYTTQTVVPNTSSAEQRQELLRALREDPSMGTRGTRQFVAFVKDKKVTTAAAFSNAVDIGLLTDIRLEQRQDSTYQHGQLKCSLAELPNDEWVHVIIKPTRPNDLGILALRREGPLLQVHEVTSGARAVSEFPGVDRVLILSA